MVHPTTVMLSVGLTVLSENHGEAGGQTLSLSLGRGFLQGSPPSCVPAGCPGVDP